MHFGIVFWNSALLTFSIQVLFFHSSYGNFPSWTDGQLFHLTYVRFNRMRRVPVSVCSFLFSINSYSEFWGYFFVVLLKRIDRQLVSSRLNFYQICCHCSRVYIQHKRCYVLVPYNDILWLLFMFTVLHRICVMIVLLVCSFPVFLSLVFWKCVFLLRLMNKPHFLRTTETHMKSMYEE